LRTSGPPVSLIWMAFMTRKRMNLEGGIRQANSE
jgi:hypothetical protein